MRHIYKKIAFVLATIGIAFGLAPALAIAGPFVTAVGGTGSSTPSGIMYGDNGATNHLNTLVIGTNLTLSGGTLNATGGGSSFGYPFPLNSTTTKLNFVGGASSSQESIFQMFYAGGTATTTINSTGDLFVAGSTTLQNFTGNNATTTNATTTSFAVTNAVSALLITNSAGSVGKYAGTNPCSANQAIVSLSALAVGSCTATFATAATTITIAGTANQISSSAGAQDLTANRTWTLSLPSLTIFPGNASSTQSSVGNMLFVGGTATTTINSTGDLYVAGSTTLQNFTGQKSTTTAATTTNLAITGILSKLLMTGATGAVIPAVGDTNFQNPITLTTTGTAGAATFIGDTLNIPQYTGGGGGGAQSSTTAQFVIYPIDKSSNPSQYFLYNATSTVVTQSANFQTLLKNAVSSLGCGGSYSGTAQGNGPGGYIYLNPGTYYTNATTTMNGNEQFSTLNAPRCEIGGAGQEATRIVVVAGADFINLDHGVIPSIHDMSIYLTGFEKGIVATSSNPNIRSIWQFDFRNIAGESTTTFATTTLFYLGNVLRGNIENIDTYGLNNTFWFYAEGNFNVGGVTIKRSFMDFGSAATSTAFKFTQQSTGFVNEVEGYYNEAIGRATGATYIDSTGLAFSHFNDSSAEQMDVLVDGKAGTISNVFDFAYSINRNGGANIRGCRFWGGSYDNQCAFQNGNNDTSSAIIDDMNSNTDFPNRISGSVTQSAGTGSASSTAVANYQIINFHGSGTFDANFKPDTDWTGYEIWSKVLAKSFKSFLSGANAATGLLVNIDTSIATNVGVWVQDNTNFAHAGDLIRLVFKNSSDTGNALDIQNLGTGASINATSTRGTDFIVQGGKSGFGTSTPYGFLSVNPNAVGTAPYFVIGSSTATNFLVQASTIANILVGTTTPVRSPTTVVAQFENPPTGTGTFASSTVVISDTSTTTSRGQIQMNNSAGATVCIDVRGTTLTVTSGVCP